MDPTLICPSCGYTLAPEFFFCPVCGKKIKDRPQSTSIGRQIYIYVMSIILPPIGVVYGMRYLKQKDTKSQIVGLVCIGLTIVVIIYTIVLTFSLVHSYSQMMNSYNPSGLPNMNSLQQTENGLKQDSQILNGQ